jgi:hypothetical protein
MVTRGVAMMTAAVAVAAGAAPAARAAARPAGAFPGGLMVTGTSWATAQRGVALAYPSRDTGARDYLVATGNGGQTWTAVKAPPLPFPEDNNSPDVAWSGSAVAVTDGTRVEVSAGLGQPWTTEKVTGASGNFFISDLTVAGGRVLGLVHAPKATAVFSGPLTSGALTQVKGLWAGPDAFGDISGTGVLQVDLGNGETAQKYWYSRGGGQSFTGGPAPCGVTEQALLGGIRAGAVTALCGAGDSAVGPGVTQAQPAVTAKLGGPFHLTGAPAVLPNLQDFAAATPKAMTVAGSSGLIYTPDAGQTWLDALTEPNGAQCGDLAFVSATTGFAACSTVTDKGKLVGGVFRTTDGGKSWTGVPL